jgi:hypothetical protein
VLPATPRSACAAVLCAADTLQTRCRFVSQDFGQNSSPCRDAGYPACDGFIQDVTWGKCRSVCASDDTDYQPCVWKDHGPLGNHQWPDDFPMYLGAQMTRMLRSVGAALVETALVITNPAISFAAGLDEGLLSLFLPFLFIWRITV